MVYRHTIGIKHSWDRLTDMFYWPAIDLLIWGLTGLYLASLNKNSSSYLFIILTGLVFWVIIWRAQYEITTNLLQELWDRNIVSIFSSPLTFGEWAASFMIFGLVKTIISLSFSAILALVFYHYNIINFGLYLLPSCISLLITGWFAGFIVAGLLIRFGGKIQTLAWTGVALLAPFSAIYYPLSVLPHWAQTIGLFIPSTYVFEGLRQILFSHTFSFDKLLISFALNGVYLVLSIWFFRWMFYKSLKLGLGRLI
ncbi:MAG: ABC transporter permease [Candidatus Levyibacteriota bacterium]